MSSELAPSESQYKLGFETQFVEKLRYYNEIFASFEKVYIFIDKHSVTGKLYNKEIAKYKDSITNTSNRKVRFIEEQNLKILNHNSDKRVLTFIVSDLIGRNNNDTYDLIENATDSSVVVLANPLDQSVKIKTGYKFFDLSRNKTVLNRQTKLLQGSTNFIKPHKTPQKTVCAILDYSLSSNDSPSPRNYMMEALTSEQDICRSIFILERYEEIDTEEEEREFIKSSPEILLEVLKFAKPIHQSLMKIIALIPSSNLEEIDYFCRTYIGETYRKQDLAALIALKMLKFDSTSIELEFNTLDFKINILNQNPLDDTNRLIMYAICNYLERGVDLSISSDKYNQLNTLFNYFSLQLLENTSTNSPYDDVDRSVVFTNLSQCIQYFKSEENRKRFMKYFDDVKQA